MLYMCLIKHLTTLLRTSGSNWLWTIRIPAVSYTNNWSSLLNWTRREPLSGVFSINKSCKRFKISSRKDCRCALDNDKNVLLQTQICLNQNVKSKWLLPFVYLFEQFTFWPFHSSTDEVNHKLLFVFYNHVLPIDTTCTLVQFSHTETAKKGNLTFQYLWQISWTNMQFYCWRALLYYAILFHPEKPSKNKQRVVTNVANFCILNHCQCFSKYMCMSTFLPKFREYIEVPGWRICHIEQRSRRTALKRHSVDDCSHHSLPAEKGQKL